MTLSHVRPLAVYQCVLADDNPKRQVIVEIVEAEVDDGTGPMMAQAR